MSREEDIRARLGAATPGPWKWQPYRSGGQTLYQVPDAPVHELNILKTTDDWPPNNEDAALIAHAPDDLRYLLDRYEQLVGAVRTFLDDPLAHRGGPMADLRDALPPEARP